RRFAPRGRDPRCGSATRTSGDGSGRASRDPMSQARPPCATSTDVQAATRAAGRVGRRKGSQLLQRFVDEVLEALLVALVDPALERDPEDRYPGLGGEDRS